jgi:hypothetical protein
MDDELSLRLERLLKDYESKISRLNLNIPGVEPPPPTKDYFAAVEALPPAAPPKRAHFEEAPAPEPRPVPLEPVSQVAAVPSPLPEIAPPQPQPSVISPAPSPAPVHNEEVRAPEERLSHHPVPPKAQAPRVSPSAPASAAPSRVWIGILLLSAVLAGLMLWRRAPKVGDGTHAAFPLPPGRKTGLVLNGGTLVTIDSQSQNLTALAPDDGRIVSQQKFPNPSLSGLAWGHGSYWSSDTETGFVFRHRPEPPFGLLQGTPLPGHAVSVLFDDGEDLWVGDARSDTIYRYKIAGDELTLRTQYSLPGVAVGGLYFSEQTLWVLDSLARKIRRYRVEDQAVPLDSFDLGHWLSLDSEAAAFAVDPSFFYLLTENPAALHRFDLKRISWSPANGSAGLQ